MAFPVEMMFESIWFQRQKYVEAENHYQLFLVNNISGALAEKHHNIKQEDIKCDKNQKSQQEGNDSGSALIQDIIKAREAIKQSLSEMGSSTNNTTSQNDQIKKNVDKLTEQVAELKTDDSKKSKKKDEDEDDDDFDLFADEEEDTEEEARRKEELVRRYNEKKANKKVIVAKSSVVLAVKPWDDETDMVEVEKLVRTIEMEGLLWGAGRLVPLAFGIRKLDIMCVIEDLKVSTDELIEKIEAFDNHVQSVDIVAFNKI